MIAVDRILIPHYFRVISGTRDYAGLPREASQVKLSRGLVPTSRAELPPEAPKKELDFLQPA